MKHILIGILFGVALSVVGFDALADCQTQSGEEQVQEQMEIKTDVPKHLEGAVIIVRTKDGRESQVPAERFKVVPRKQQFIVTKTKQATSTVCSASKNRVSVLGGYGPKGGLKAQQTSPTSAEVETSRGIVGGAQYQRMLNDTLSVGVQGQSNKTGALLIGIDF